MSTMASPTGRGLPADGSRCMRRPGPALTSTTAPRCSSSGRPMSTATTSTPAMSRPTTRAASTARAATSGWTSVGHVGGRAAGAQVAVAADQHAHPGRRHRIGRVALLGQDGQGDRVELDEAQDGGVAVAAARVAVDLGDELADGRPAVADDLGRLAPGRGHQPVADDQQAVVGAGDELLDEDAARLPRGRRRRRAATCSRVVRLVATPRPWLPYCGLTTTGTPISSAAAQASSASATGRPSGTGTPTACSSVRVSCLSWAIASAMALVRSVSAVQMRRWWTPWPSCTRLPSFEPAHGNAALPGGPDDGRRCSGRGGRRGPARAAAAARRPGRTAGRARAARQRSRAASRQARPSASSSYSTTTRYEPGRRGVAPDQASSTGCRPAPGAAGSACRQDARPGGAAPELRGSSRPGRDRRSAPRAATPPAVPRTGQRARAERRAARPGPAPPPGRDGGTRCWGHAGPRFANPYRLHLASGSVTS